MLSAFLTHSLRSHHHPAVTMIRVCRRGGLLPRSACTAHARVATGDDSTDSEAEREVERARILARRKAIEKALREAQGLSSSEDEDEPKRASRSWDQLWYTKVKQPLIQRFRGRRAATQIQAQWRARKARRHLLTLQRIVLREERMKAAFVIQNVWRGHLGRVRMRNHRKACHRAARLIQKGWHRFLFFAAIRRTVRGIMLAACANKFHTHTCVCVWVPHRLPRARLQSGSIGNASRSSSRCLASSPKHGCQDNGESGSGRSGWKACDLPANAYVL